MIDLERESDPDRDPHDQYCERGVLFHLFFRLGTCIQYFTLKCVKKLSMIPFVQSNVVRNLS